MSRKNLYNLLIVSLFLSISTITYADIGQKIAQLNIDEANLDDVIKVFGEPTKYVWGNQTLEKDNLPRNYVIVYQDDFNVFMSNNKVIELRHEGPGTGYAWHGKLKVGDSLEKALGIAGKPTKTVEGQENLFEDDVLYKDIDGRKGYCYYARTDQDVRLWFKDYKLLAIYMTRSDYGDRGGGEMKKADIPSTSKINEEGRIEDKIDYPFVSDPQVIGAWKSVDFVRTIDDFKPDKKNWAGEFYLNHLIFEEGGKNPGGFLTWSKGLVINKHGKTASTYTIKSMDGDEYLFYQWKSGDYTIRHRQPYYYVLKKTSLDNVKSEPMFGRKAQIPPTSTINEDGRIVDKIDYPFVNDPDVIGTWKSVDFVENIEDFNPDQKDWKGDLYLKEIICLENGKTKGPWSWTKGLLLHPGDKTASKYLIKEIDGTEYMFFEWKSGDYTIRHMKPSFYVLKKE
jgi:hypothetical protein